MKRFFSFLLFVLLLVIALLSLQIWKERGFQGTTLRRAWRDLTQRGDSPRRPEKYTVAEGPRVNVKDVDVLAAMSRQRILLAKAVVPSVVSITTSRAVQNPSVNDDPFFQFFHRGMRRGGSATQRALGSGAIVSKEGHVVTNNHVIDEMDEIEVKLSDGRVKQATLIGTDPDTDLAILKIDADNLQPIPFGSSDAVEVGETVMAIGNPYGLDESVTQGIISAKGRRGSENISDLFQTDSVLNPGNSGGPLVNVRGELIGINVMIASQSGSWQGVGFAIPSDTVRSVMGSILKQGRAVHGYLGIYQQPFNEEVSRQHGLGGERGVLVDSVAAGSPAEKADIQPGDLIQKFNNQPVRDFQELRHSVAQVAIDTSVPIELVREGKKVSVTAAIAERPPPEARLSQNPPLRPPSKGSTRPPNPQDNGRRTSPASDADSLNGLQVAELAPVALQRLGLPPRAQGVLVRRVEPGTSAAENLRADDVIEQINQQPIASLADYGKVVRSLPEKQPVVFSVVRERSRTLVVLPGG